MEKSWRERPARTILIQKKVVEVRLVKTDRLISI